MKYPKLKWVISALLFLLINTYRVEARLHVKEIISRVSPAVVTVLSYDKQGKAIRFGSGFIVTHNGLTVSNYHVIKGAYKAAVKVKDGDVYRVTGIVDFDCHRDFVILKIAGYGLPTVRMGNSNSVEIGDDVIAIGNPGGLEHTASTGIIGQRRNVGSYTLLQITAPISSGSSGGPLINMDCQVIGITTSTILEGQNLNFALPINYVRGVLETNKSVKYTLAKVAQWQTQQDEEKLKRVFAKLFTIYEDPDNSFSMVYPRAWRVERSEGWGASKTTYFRTTMMAPRDAHRADVDGYLSEGIRVTFRLPPKDRVWTMDSVSDWAPHFKDERLRANPGFALTDSFSISFAGQPAHVYTLVGQNENIPEPEKSTFIILAGKKYRLIIELVSPTSKLSSYETIYLALLKTFKLSQYYTAE